MLILILAMSVWWALILAYSGVLCWPRSPYAGPRKLTRRERRMKERLALRIRTRLFPNDKMIMQQTPLKPEDVTIPKSEETLWPIPAPKPWPKQGDRVRAASGKEGDVLENNNGRVKVDWGLYVTIHDAGELEFVE